MTDSDSELHPYVEWIVREARRPVVSDTAARERIMASVRAEPAPRSRRRVWSRVLEPRVFSLSPVSSVLLAASLVGIGIVTSQLLNNRDVRPSGGQPSVAVAPPQLPAPDTVVKFVFVAPNAANVALAGDFNGWDPAKTPMVRAGGSGVWTVTLPLTAGRHLYSFVVDGSSWIADPSAPLAPDDGFGHASSVKLVRRGSLL